jgi:hypothetical protein
LNFVLVGEPVEWIQAWRSRGLVASNRDLILQALQALSAKIIEQDIKRMRIKSAEEENSID